MRILLPENYSYLVRRLLSKRIFLINLGFFFINLGVYIYVFKKIVGFRRIFHPDLLKTGSCSEPKFLIKHTCSRTSKQGEAKSSINKGIAPLSIMTSVLSDVPDAILVSAQAASNYI